MGLFSEWMAEKLEEAARTKKSRRPKKRVPVANVSMDSWIKAVQALAKDLEEYRKVKKISDQKAKDSAKKAKEQQARQKPKETKSTIAKSQKPEKVVGKIEKPASKPQKFVGKSEKPTDKKNKSVKKTNKSMKPKAKKNTNSTPYN